MKTIGVMCYQGGGHLHISALQNLGFQTLSIYAQTDFSKVDGLILPGGESSVQYSYCLKNGLDKKIVEYAYSKKPILGTCAGAILLSNYFSEKVKGLGLIKANLIRNFYGRQIKSGNVKTDMGNEVTFIRAPGIIDIDLSKVTILDTYEKNPILIHQDNIYCATFHPELSKLDSSNVMAKIFK
jgi:5'-phosphate synthase pdxT subunit